MARIARIVAPGYPHHITQRGARRQKTFFNDGDYRLYLHLLKEWCVRFSVNIWTYCLMPNHVHLVAVPEYPSGLRNAIGETHRRYTRYINRREGWKGHLWQERFCSYVMDTNYLLAAVRYIELNPVRAGLVKNPLAYKWSSAGAHIQGIEDNVADLSLIRALVSDWGSFLNIGASAGEVSAIQSHATTGWPLGEAAFVSGLERQLGRKLVPRRPGRPCSKETVYCPQLS